MSNGQGRDPVVDECGREMGREIGGKEGRPRRRRHPVVRIVLALLWVLCVPAVGGMAFGFLMPLDLDNDSKWWMRVSWVAFMARTFSLHMAIALGAAGVLALLLRAPRLTLLSLASAGVVAMLSGVSPVGGATATAGPSPRPRLVVMTCNLWKGLTDVSSVADEIARHDPDVIVFQEYTYIQDEALRSALAAEYPYVAADPQQDFSGMATYSRLPLRELSGRLLGPRGASNPEPRYWERQVCCEMLVGEGDSATAVVVQNIHLPTAPMARQTLRQHRRLVGELGLWLADETRPVVCAGDFNCTPMAAEAGAIRAMGLVDAHRVVGAGIGATWGQRLVWPGFRIDHVYSRGLRPISCVVGGDVGSDHRPVIAVLELE